MDSYLKKILQFMQKHIPIWIGLILVFISLWLLVTSNKTIRGMIDRLDDMGYDLQLRTRIMTHTENISDAVAIIDIDDKSLKALGRWPWPRSKVAELVTALTKNGAAVIAFDIFFPEVDKNIATSLKEALNNKMLLTPTLAQELDPLIPLFDEDVTLANALKETEATLAISFLPRFQQANKLPPPLLTITDIERRQLDLISAFGYLSNIQILADASKGSGFINIYPDLDGIIRHAPLVMTYGNGVYPSLALQSVLSFFGEKATLVTPFYGNSKKMEGVMIGSQMIPTDEKGQVLIPFVGKSYTFPFYSAIDVLENKVKREALLGKILFIGTSATGLGDLQATAIQNPFPGVEIQATLVNGILQKNFSYKPAWILGADVVIVTFFGILAALIFPFLGPRTLSSIILLLPGFILLINNWIWLKTGLIISLLIPTALILMIAMVSILYGYVFEFRRREQLKVMFGQYVPKTHIDEMLKSEANYGLRGDDREMTVIFADIRNFTTISEGLTASDLVNMLNTFFTPMTEVIFNHKGTIDKYVGDLIMAFWGAPLSDKNHARHAIESALEMQKKVKELRPTLKMYKWPDIEIGIGINSGRMSVGDMGSKYRRNYTVLGDAVNLGSRVEGLTKYYGVGIIATESTQLHQNKFIFRKLDLVRVKGKKNGVAIYEVVGYAANLTQQLNQELKQYHEALDLYFQHKWDDSLAGFTALHRKFPEQKIYLLYINRLKEFKENPPPADWDGVYVHLQK